MMRFSLTILLVLILSSCQMTPSAVPVSKSTTEAFPTEIPTSTATAIPTATIIPTPTVIPTATTSPITLEESAGALCEKSYSAPVVTKEFEIPYLGMSKTERDTVPAWRISNGIPHIFALSEESVHSIICSLETRRQVGIYTDGSAAFQLILNIRILSWP